MTHWPPGSALGLVQLQEQAVAGVAGMESEAQPRSVVPANTALVTSRNGVAARLAPFQIGLSCAARR